MNREADPMTSPQDEREELAAVIRQSLFEADEMSDRQANGGRLNQADAERMRSFVRILAADYTKRTPPHTRELAEQRGIAT